MKSVYSDVKWCFNASWGLKGLSSTVQTKYTDLQLLAILTPFKLLTLILQIMTIVVFTISLLNQITDTGKEMCN